MKRPREGRGLGGSRFDQLKASSWSRGGLPSVRYSWLRRLAAGLSNRQWRDGATTSNPPIGLRPLRLGMVCALACFSVRAAAAEHDAPFDFETLRARAQALAARTYVAPADQSPDWLRQLTYDDYRLIEFNAAQSLWRREKLPFEAQFFHPGNLYTRAVQVHELHDGRAASLPFRPDYFNYRSLKTGSLPEALGFAGVRLHYPLNHVGDELGAFLGASYFRFLCAGAAYGLSARGIAIDTAEAGAEEFPAFTEFWLERPASGAKKVVVFALLDGPSVTGAYRFEITPGNETVQHVRAVLFFRTIPRRLGLAPLTSMFWRGENSGPPPEKDPRPEVHDSDGLLVAMSSGEWLWRPLTDPRAVRVSALAADNPKGFGLLQRDRDFEHYRDREAHYDRRPSAWIEPIGSWGRGAIELVEIPTMDEYNDNIVAFWRPAVGAQIGRALELEYRVHWTLARAFPAGGAVVATRADKGAGESTRFQLDFRVPDLGGEPTPIVSAGNGQRLKMPTIEKLTPDDWRVTFEVLPDAGGRPLELRCYLRDRGGALTETWSYLWQP